MGAEEETVCLDPECCQSSQDGCTKGLKGSADDGEGQIREAEL